MARKKAAAVVRQDVPPVEMEWVPIYSAKPDATIHLVSLNEGLEGFFTHYHLNRTIPCIGKESGCICATALLARRWKGYLGAWDPQLGRCVLAEITVDCFRAAPHVFSANRNLRGMQFGLFRLVQRSNGPVRLTLGGRLRDDLVEQLPPPLKVQRCLWRIWGLPVDATT